HVTASKAGLPVKVKDIANDGILNAMAYNFKLLDKKRKRRIISKAELQKQMLMINGGVDYQGFDKADVVIEAVFEDLS
ncbi:3-hydroxyacyl-CoA dehydrogenase NAD-binding domain-containing protein, partial [Halomonas sp. SIMBA_159]